MKTRVEHIEWCKQNAREYLDEGDPVKAVTSMMSDMQKHPETNFGPDSALSALGLLAAMSRDPDEARRYIEGFR